MAKISFVFSGQGAQYPGMGKSLYECSAAARRIFDTADELRHGTIRQCFDGCIEELSQTKNTQPCLFCVDLAAAEALRENGVEPFEVAGFSLGEIAAISFANMIKLEDSIGLVTKRGLLMQAAAEKRATAMAAVLKLEDSVVEDIASKYELVFPVNYNCPGQLVVAGDKEQLEFFCKDIAEAGGRAKVLNVSGGFHSPFMADAATGLRKELHSYDLNAPAIPVYSNYTAVPYDDNRKDLLAAQISHPVLWKKIIENMIADGTDTFIECGAGKTLCGLIKKIDKTVRVFNVQDEESLKATLEGLKAE